MTVVDDAYPDAQNMSKLPSHFNNHASFLFRKYKSVPMGYVFDGAAVDVVDLEVNISHENSLHSIMVPIPPV